MHNLIRLFLTCSGLILIFTSCLRTETDEIVYNSINKEFVLIRDVLALQESDDEISNHIDSILSGLIDEEFVSTGQKTFDLDADLVADIGFEIINLHAFNPDGLPESFDSLAARSIPFTIQILDNSTYGYPDALDVDDPISGNGNWSGNTSVLGTFMNAGQFQGRGEKYLGIRFPRNNEFNYGWIKIYCSQHNDTLRIIEYAYNNIFGSAINAGQKN